MDSLIKTPTEEAALVETQKRYNEEIEQTIWHLSEMVTSLNTTIDGLIKSREAGYIHEQLSYIQDAIRRIVRVLHEGNGEKALLVRVALLEGEVSQLNHDIIEARGIAEKTTSLASERENISRKGRYALAVALVSALAALATSVITFFAQ